MRDPTRGVSPFSGNLFFLSDIAEAVGTHEDEQEGESAAFRAAKGQGFPTCESRKGHRVSSGAKGEEVPSFQVRKQYTKSLTSKKSLREMVKLHKPASQVTMMQGDGAFLSGVASKIPNQLHPLAERRL